MVFKPIETNLTIKDCSFYDVRNWEGFRSEFIEVWKGSLLIIENSTFENLKTTFLTGSVSQIYLNQVTVFNLDLVDSWTFIDQF